MQWEGCHSGILPRVDSSIEDIAVISCSRVTKSSIRRHYDLISPFYRLLWGRHIHHGLWDADDTQFKLPARAAQVRLVDTLADLADISRPMPGGHDDSADAAGRVPRLRVIDVGCGLGGSSIHLAATRHCDVTGITISGLQRFWANWAAIRHGVSGQVRFVRGDAEAIKMNPGEYDRLWSVECTEHLFDKPGFFREASTWLRPGGKLAVCAWVAGDEPLSEAQHTLVHEVCEGMFCPSFGTTGDYVEWLTQAGLANVRVHDWTERVAQTWVLCTERMRRSQTDHIAPLFGRDAVIFVSKFEALLEAYRTGAMRYAAFLADKPAGR